jgi:superkiller protein 3
MKWYRVVPALIVSAFLVSLIVPKQSLAQDEEYKKKLEKFKADSLEFERKKKATEGKNEEIRLKNKRNDLVNQGNSALRGRQYKKAIGLFNEAIKIDPSFARAYYGLGLAYTGDNKSSKALAAYENAVENNPNYASVYNAQGNLLLKLGRREHAASSYKRATEIDPTHAKAHYGLATIYANSNPPDHEKAVAEFRLAINTKPAYALAHSGLGTSLVALGRTSQAIEALQTAVGIDPRFSDAYFRLAKVLNDVGRYREAREAAVNCIRIVQSKRKFYAPAHFEAGRAYEQLGNIAEAIKQYELSMRDNTWRALAQHRIDEIKRNGGGRSQ